MKKLLTALSALAVIGAPLFASAHEVALSAGVNVSAEVTAKGDLDARTTALISDAKDRAAREIDRRVDTLSSLKDRITTMPRISATDATSLGSIIDAQVSALTSLKAQIAADTSTTTLKAEVKSITDSYRIYALIMPQLTVIAASERSLAVSGQFDQLSATLEASIASSTSASDDLTAALADMKAKIADAKAKAQAAIDEVKVLQPDNGDKGIQKSNLAALKDAQAKIRAAQQDIVAARKDAGTIVKGLRGEASAEATTSAEVETH